MTVDEEWLLLGKALEKIALLYGKYQVALKAQRKAVVENKALDLLPLQTEMDAIAENLDRLEKRRLSHMENISRYAGRELLNIQDLVKEFPHLDGEYLASRARMVKEKTQEMRRLTKANVELMEISRNVIRVTLHTVMSQNTDPRDKAWRTYGAAGQYAGAVRRAPIHMVNKRG